MKFKEVAHLYMGCLGQATYNAKDESTGEAIPVELPTFRRLESVGIEGDRRILMWVGGNLSAGELKPILRKLSDMNVIEMMEYVNLIPFYKQSHTFDFEHKDGAIYFRVSYMGQFNSYKKWIDILTANPEQFVYLLSKHFDIFGLIDSGEAIDSATLNPNPYAN